MSAPFLRCQARTASRGTLRMQGGGQCPREARWVDPKGFVYCAQHSKDYPTILRKGTGKIRANMKPIVKEDTL